MAKITISDIAKSLVANNNLPKSKAEELVSCMFELIQETLQTDSSVKIKGLGTFKVIGVDARESINVNTGERVVIEGHSKVSFTPDTAMKELVNKPFSQFETVILNDGVEFNDIEENSETTDSLDSENLSENNKIESENLDLSVSDAPIVGFYDEETNAPITDALNPSESETTDSEIVDSADAKEISHEIPTPSIDEQIIQAEEIEVSHEDEPESKPDEEIAPQAVNVSFADSFKEIIQESDNGTTEITEQEQTDETIEYDDEEEDNNKSKKWFVALCIILVPILMLLSAYGGYLYGTKDNKEVNPVDSVVSMKENVDLQQSISAVDSLKEIVDTVANQDTVVATESVNNTKEAFDSSIYDSLDERVRTGAYRIIGTDTILTVRNGETMRRLCKRTLGPGMACYIEVYNGLAPNTPLTPGQKIKIPKLEWRKKNNK